ncbi:MAG: transposase [Balneolaceae bacterium]
MKEIKQRKTYSIEFKQQAVELALHTGDIMQTARDLGVDHSSIRKWIRDLQEHSDQAFPGSGNPKDKGR